MDDEADVRLFDSHAERDRSNHHRAEFDREPAETACRASGSIPARWENALTPAEASRVACRWVAARERQ
jgi:hypothetical protein